MNYSSQLQCVLMHAYDTAEKLDHNCVATEHLLIGIMKIQGSRLSEYLVKKGITVNLLMNDLQVLFGFGSEVQSKVVMTSTVYKILRKAETESLKKHLQEVSLDDVVCALLESENNVAQELLRRRGIFMNELICELSGPFYEFAA